MKEKWNTYWKTINNFIFSEDPPIARTRDLVAKSLLAFWAIVIVFLCFPSVKTFQYADLRVGSIVDAEIIAPFTFPILKDEADLERERREARQSVLAVFNRADSVKAMQEKGFRLFWSAFQFKPLTEGRRDTLQKLLGSRYGLDFFGKHWNSLFIENEYGKKLDLITISRASQEIVRDIMSEGIIDIEKSKIQPLQIVSKSQAVEDYLETKYVYDLKEAQEQITIRLKSRFPANSDAFKIAYEVISSFLTPDLLYNENETGKRVESAVSQISTTRGFVYESERIINSHEIVTPDVMRKLRSLAIAKTERGQIAGGIQAWLPDLGKILLVFIVLSVLVFYFRFFKPNIFYNNRLLLLVTIILLGQISLVAFLLSQFNWSEFLLPVVIGSFLLAMLFDGEVAFIGTLVVSFLLGGVRGNEFEIAVITMLTGSTVVFAVRKIRQRRQLFLSALYLWLIYSVIAVSLGFLQYSSWTEIGRNIGFAFLNSLGSHFVAFGLVALFEWLFNLTTNITLLELADLNHPLLKRLSMEAPGTFHHSILVGNLAEAAAEVIGANSLLARVGCYYHDVGKMEKPEYFIENQQGEPNRHEKLSPNMSSLILASHVKAGTELAKRYKLPKIIQQFVTEHHGTSLMHYFYHKALENNDPRDVQETDFRYPGPNPQSKETGIVMLADSVEASTRSLRNPSPQRIRAMIESVVEAKFREGHFDDCELTLRDLHRIIEAFVPVIMSIHHVRIEYPTMEETEKLKNAEYPRSPTLSATPFSGDNH